MLQCTGPDAVEMVDQLACLACSVTTNYRYLPDTHTFSKTYYFCNLSHLPVAEAGAIQSVERRGSAAGTGKSRTAAQTTTTAIGTWKDGFNFRYAGVFIHSEFLRGKV